MELVFGYECGSRQNKQLLEAIETDGIILK